MEPPRAKKPKSPSIPAKKKVEVIHHASGLVGSIVEKGFSSPSSYSSSPLPMPSVLPFPVARHRSHGPRWAPARAEMVADEDDADEEDRDDSSDDPIASFANPIERKKKKGMDFSKWRELMAEEESPRKPQMKKREAKTSKKVEIIKGNGSSDVKESTLPKQKSSASYMEVDSVAEMRPVGGVQPKVLKAESNEFTAPYVTDDIDAENTARLNEMSPDEIAEAQAEIMDKMGPGLVEMLRKRGKDKLGRQKGNGVVQDKGQRDVGGGQAVGSGMGSAKAALAGGDWLSAGDMNSSSWKDWSERVEKVRELRFSLDGNVMGIGSNSEQSNGLNTNVSQYNMQNVAERDFLRTEGDPASVGYTIKETLALTRSIVPGQRTLALHLLASVLSQALYKLQKKDIGCNHQNANTEFVDWQAVWAFTLGPEPQMILSLRIALDDNHESVVLACAKVIQCILSCDLNEKFFDTFEKLPSNAKDICTAPVFRSRPDINGGFLHGGFWKYNTKPSNILPVHDKDDDGDDEGTHTIQDDVVIAEQDVAAGLIRMGILPRICYLLEMNPVPVLEECLVSILIALARHSLTSANAIMKCPRLVQSVTNIFTKQGMRELYISQIKATILLKVLSKSSRQACLGFVKDGNFQKVMWQWYRNAFSLEHWIKSGKEHCRLTSALMVEQLRFWKVCIQYGYCITYFADLFPVMCLWLSPPPFDKLNENNLLGEFASITRESYLVLRSLAQRLPILHSTVELNKQSIAYSDDNMEAWCWSHVIPMVDIAVKWLLLKDIPFIYSLLGTDRQLISHVQGHHISCILWVISAVLHMLSSVFDRIAPERIDDKHNTTLPWLPEFVPMVGLKIIKNGFLNFLDSDNLDPEEFHGKGSSLALGLCYLRHQVDYDVSLPSVSCICGIVQIANSIDRCIQRAKSMYHSEHLEQNGSEMAAKILAEGIIKCAQSDLKSILNVFMTLVSSGSHAVQSIEMFGRGGPAPGVGIGWGSAGGGFWSASVLLAQVDSLLILDLIKISPLGLDELASAYSLELEKGKSGKMLLALRKISSVFALCLVAGPGDRNTLDEALEQLLQTSILKYLSFYIFKLGCSLEPSTFTFKYTEEEYLLFSKILNSHFRSRWLDLKKKSCGKANAVNSSHEMTRATSALEPIHEDLETVDMPDKGLDANSLMVEWAHQRLPLPAHWFLSAISNIADSNGKSTYSYADVSDVTKGGLILLLGFEAMSFSCPDQQDSPIMGVPLVWKLHALSTAIYASMDVLEDEKSRNNYEILQEIYGKQLDQLRSRYFTAMQNKYGKISDSPTLLGAQGCNNLEFLNFQTQVHESYTTFVENLIEQFGAVSYGDLIYGRQVAFYLHRSVEVTIRLATWNALSNGQLLELLPPLNKSLGEAEGYLEPVEDNEKVLEAYVKSWILGALDRAAARLSISYSLVVHHLSCFIFNTDACDKLALRNKLAKSLLRSYSQKQHQESMLLTVLKHRLPESGVSFHNAELGKRFSLLKEFCEENSVLLAQVEKLKSSAFK